MKTLFFNKTIMLFCLTVSIMAFFNCSAKAEPSPENVVKQYIGSFIALDYDLLLKNTFSEDIDKGTSLQLKKSSEEARGKMTQAEKDEMKARYEQFKLNLLSESINGDKAYVLATLGGDEPQAFYLIKENGLWKLVEKGFPMGTVRLFFLALENNDKKSLTQCVLDREGDYASLILAKMTPNGRDIIGKKLNQLKQR